MRSALRLAVLAAFAATAYGQSSSPWEQAVQVLEASFTGPIARGLSLVAIVVGGLMFAFGESASRRTLAGIVFGVGMAVEARVSRNHRHRKLDHPDEETGLPAGIHQ